jgi:hypothetical protein
MAILFSNVTDDSGISYIGGSHGAAWGDFNNDRFPDLWVGNHGIPATLYHNQKDGSFIDVTLDIFGDRPKGDQHAAAWADFDNDGDLDLIQLIGADSGKGSLTDPQLANQFFVNENGKLQDRAIFYGLDYIGSRGRNPLWFDYDNDGILDLFQGAVNRSDGLMPATIFFQENREFIDLHSRLDFDVAGSKFGLLSDLSGDNKLELLLLNSLNGLYIYDSETIEDITASVIEPNLRASDVISEDFNGDLLPDLYLTRQGLGDSGLAQETANKIRLNFRANENHRGLTFQTTGDITLDLLTFGFAFEEIDPDKIFIGAEGLNPADLGIKPYFDNSVTTNLKLTLSPQDFRVEGILPFLPGKDEGIYLGYDPNLQQWQVSLSTGDRDLVAGIIESTETISELTSLDFNYQIEPSGDLLLLNNGSTLVDSTLGSGINTVRNAGTSAVAEDFDNDMDIDIYVLASNSAGNEPNILYENQGDGTFIPIENAGGAIGTQLGIGDSVTTVDYNNDGFLDLFVTNGEFPPILDDAPYELFENQGNENHWLEIDLEGVKSNRDGIGAKVYLTAGGVTQLRQQTGGMHEKAQNHSRLHFGLGQNKIIQKLVVEWPSGVVQTVNNLPADQLIQIIEPSDSFSPGKPTFTVGQDSGVFLWQDTFDGVYHLRTLGNVLATEFEVNLIATDKPLEITPISLERGSIGKNRDSLQITDFGFSLTSKLFRGEDGVDFHLKPGTQVLLSVTQNGIPNPRQLYLGQEGLPLSPDGWILSSDQFPMRPAFTPGEDLGLFVGKGTDSQLLEFRWNGDNQPHVTNLTAIANATTEGLAQRLGEAEIASEQTAEFTPVSMEKNDRVTTFNNGIEIEGLVGSSWDGLNIETTETTQIGFTYQQDSLTQTDFVNPDDPLLGQPNAYWLPLASPYGQPNYDPTSEAGLFLWKDDSKIWHLRVTGQSSGSRYVGSLESDSPAVSVKQVGIEANDVIDTTNLNRIDFELNVWKGFEDGIDFRFAAGSSLVLNLDRAEEVVDLVKIGEQNWSVSQLPLDLGEWT